MADLAPALIWVADAARRAGVRQPRAGSSSPAAPARRAGRRLAGGPAPGGPASATWTTVAAAAAAPPGWEVEFRLRRADGAYHWLLERAVPIGPTDGVAGYVGSCTDINARYRETERQSLLAAVGAALDRASRRRRAARPPGPAGGRHAGWPTCARAAGRRRRPAAPRGDRGARRRRRRRAGAALDPETHDGPRGRRRPAVRAAAGRAGRATADRSADGDADQVAPCHRVVDAVRRLRGAAARPRPGARPCSGCGRRGGRPALTTTTTARWSRRSPGAPRWRWTTRCCSPTSGRPRARLGAAAAGDRGAVRRDHAGPRSPPRPRRHLQQPARRAARVGGLRARRAQRALIPLAHTGRRRRRRARAGRPCRCRPPLAVDRGGPRAAAAVDGRPRAVRGPRPDPSWSRTSTGLGLRPAVAAAADAGGRRRRRRSAIGFRAVRRFAATERATLLALAEQCAQALDRARLYRAEQPGRRDAAAQPAAPAAAPARPARPGRPVPARRRGHPGRRRLVRRRSSSTAPGRDRGR